MQQLNNLAALIIKRGSKREPLLSIVCVILTAVNRLVYLQSYLSYKAHSKETTNCRIQYNVVVAGRFVFIQSAAQSRDSCLLANS